MKKIVFLTAMFCLLTISAFAQDKKVDFSGNWMLKLGESDRIESLTMNVTQSEKDIKIETTVKRKPPSEGGGQLYGPEGSFGRGGGFNGDVTTTYSLDGKETKAQSGGQGRKITLKAKFEKDGKLKLSSSRSFETPNGEISITTKETWSLSEDGKTLNVKRDMETPRGTNSSEMVFMKK